MSGTQTDSKDVPVGIEYTPEQLLERAKIKNQSNELALARAEQGIGLAQEVGAGVSAIMPRNMQELTDLASIMASAGPMIGKSFRGSTGDCAAIIMQSMRWGMDPFAVSQKCYKVNDVIAYEAQLVNAVILAKAPLKKLPEYSYSGQGDDMVCTIEATLYDKEGGEYVITFEGSRLGDVYREKGSPLWKTKPKQQLAYNTVRDMARVHFSGIIMGVYTRDEVEDMRPLRGVSEPKEIRSLDIGMEDLGASKTINSTETKEEAVEEAEVIEEPAQEDPITDEGGDAAEADANVAEDETVPPEWSDVESLLDIFIETPNHEAMLKVWEQHISSIDIAADVVATWTAINSHEAFLAAPDDVKGAMRSKTNKRVDHLENSLPA